MATRAVEEQLARIAETRKRPKLRCLSGKGRPPPRSRPEDFEVIFVEVGRLNCETYYRASRITVNRWLDECGKERLIEQRAKFVEHQRRTLGPLREHVRKGPKEPRTCMPEPAAPEPVDEQISICLAKHAAHFLRMPKHGGWRVSPADNGIWNVGLKKMTAAAMLAQAVRAGFDVEHASLSCDLEEQGPNGSNFGDYCF